MSCITLVFRLFLLSQEIIPFLVAEVHHQCATGFIKANLPYDEQTSARCHRFYSSQFWQEGIWQKYPADEYLLGGEILKSEEDRLVATGVPAFVVHAIELRKLNERLSTRLCEMDQRISKMTDEISDLKEVVRTEK